MNALLDRMEWMTRVRWRPIGWSTVLVLLALPLVAMQFGNQVNWTGGDFLAAAIMLGGTGALLELAARRSEDIVYRLAAAVGLLTALLLLWVNVAVGVIGAEGNPANGWYLAIYVVGFLGATVSRLQPAGMAATVVAMALVQAAITLLAIMRDAGGAAASASEILAINGCFILLWLVSALLFVAAARRRGQAKAVNED
jgi:heme/copper-type cytochrome/quinol oxidase subunit 4